MHAITYNLVRALMYESHLESGVPLDRFSFKGTLDTLLTWRTQCQLDTGKLRREKLRHTMLDILARDTLPYRPRRSEPRAHKRRPKTFQLLTAPRHLMVVSPSRKLK